ncbi:hypothetical protein [Paucibacter soli]|uniref:hypothetical protein n=1 Tax=Paucibacter soli TaxID=3133433 RepID=UPI003098AC24
MSVDEIRARADSMVLAHARRDLRIPLDDSDRSVLAPFGRLARKRLFRWGVLITCLALAVVAVVR